MDIAADLGALLNGEEARVRSDIAAVMVAAKDRRVKVIMETGYRSRDAIRRQEGSGRG